MKTDLKTLFEMAGIANQPKAKQILKENFDDQHAYVMDFYEKNKSKLSDEVRRRFDRLDSELRDAYEEDNDDALYDSLDSLRRLLGIKGTPVL